MELRTIQLIPISLVEWFTLVSRARVASQTYDENDYVAVVSTLTIKISVGIALPVRRRPLVYPQMQIVEETQQNHHGYDHEYLTDRNVRITLAIFYELPSPFLRITLATPTITLWNTLASISNHPRQLIYFPSAITELHVHEFLKLCFHTSGGIIADHMSDDG